MVSYSLCDHHDKIREERWEQNEANYMGLHRFAFVLSARVPWKISIHVAITTAHKLTIKCAFNSVI